MGRDSFLKNVGSVFLKSVITLPRMLLYFMQPITYNESLFHELFEDKKKR